MGGETTGEILERLLTTKGLSQRKLAMLSGVDRGYINALIKGKRQNISQKTARKLAQALEVSPEIFLAEEALAPRKESPEERRPMKKAGIQMAIKRLCARAGITGAKRGPHTFRHTAAINYLRNGGSEFTLQIMLGHSTLSMTRRYVSTLGEEDLIKAHQLASPVDNLFKK